MDDVLQWIAQYWVSWLCALLAGGVVFFAKRYISMEKKAAEEKWKDKEMNMCGKIITNFDEKIEEVKDNSTQKETKIYKEIDSLRKNLNEKDNNIYTDLNSVHSEVNAIKSGILSIQGKQFREMCEELLEKDYISVEEYQEFEDEYAVYKSLGGNHRGDALHARVVAKCDKQDNKKKGDSQN